MEAIIKLLCVIFFVAFLSRGSVAQCKVNDLLIRQTATGAVVKNKTQWNVTVTNNCPCNQFNAKLLCKGFRTVEPLEASVITKSGDFCLLVNNEEPIHPFVTLSFTYAWGNKFAFKPYSSNTACS